jgi:hypothetical protein
VADRRVLALDLGTSSVRALVFDDRGAPLPDMLARRPTQLDITDEGKAELDPDGVVAAIGECLDELNGRGGLDGVQEVATSCAWHSVIALDRDGRRLTGALTWADTRAAPLVGELRSRGDMDRLQAATGARPHTLYWTVKLPWLAGELSPAPARYLGLAEYATGALLGDPGASPSMASGTGCSTWPRRPGTPRRWSWPGWTSGPCRRWPAPAGRAGWGRRGRGGGRPWPRPPGTRRPATGPPPTWAPAASPPTGWPSTSAPRRPSASSSRPSRPARCTGSSGGTWSTTATWSAGPPSREAATCTPGCGR